MKSKITTIMFTDIQGFTQLTGNSSRKELMEFISQINKSIVNEIERYEGKIIKTIGDAFLVTFESATAAVLAGRDIQLATQELRKQGDDQATVRVAIHTGEVTETADDIFGESVNLASRIESQTDPGDVYFSESTYLAMQADKVPTAVVGERVFKGIANPVRLYRIDIEAATQVSKAQRGKSFYRLITESHVTPFKILRPARLRERIGATLLDFVCAFFLTQSLFIAARLPGYLATLNDVHFVHHSEIKSDNYTPIPQVWSYSGVVMGLTKDSQAFYDFEFKDGKYDIALIMVSSKRQAESIKTTVNKHEFVNHVITSTGLLFRTMTARDIFLRKGDRIRFTPEIAEHQYVRLDGIEFFPAESNAFRPRGVERAMRAPGILGKFFDYNFGYLINYDDYNLHFTIAPVLVVFFFLQIVFLTFVTWTPGSLVMRVRIIRESGKALGIFSILWGLGFILSLFFLGLGFLWYRFNKDKRTWFDMMSGSKVIKL